MWLASPARGLNITAQLPLAFRMHAAGSSLTLAGMSPAATREPTKSSSSSPDLGI